MQVIGRWILFLSVVTGSSLPTKAQDAQDIQKSCGNFVQQFYDWYVKRPQFPRALKYRPSAFSPELYRRLKEDHEAQVKATDGIAGLDWDPIVSGNDLPPGARYVVGRIELKGEHACWAEIHREWQSEESKVLVAAELENNVGRWHFVNFYYSFPDSDLAASVSRGGLLTLLKNLREARQKAAKAPSSPEPMPPQTKVPPKTNPKPVSEPTPRS